MRLMNGVEIISILEGLIHVGKQEGKLSVYLTAKRIAQVTGRGDLDFGGGEFRQAEREWLEPQKRNPDDKYGWWDLDRGRFLIEFNESIKLPDGALGLIFPAAFLTENGAGHPAMRVESAGPLPYVPVVIPDAGVRIKENGRVSTLIIMAPD